MSIVAATTFGASAARADDGACARLVVEPRGDMARRIEQWANARDDIDRCAKVRVRKTDGTITLEVTLPDGRSTSRSIRREEDAASTLAALLLVPRPLPALEDETPTAPPAVDATSEAAPELEAAPPRNVVPPAPPLLVAARPREDVAPVDASPPRRVRVELSLLSVTHVNDEQIAVGLGMLSFVEIDQWLAGLAGRADYLRGTTNRDEPHSALTLGVLGGRRARFGSMALDWYAGPALAFQGVTTTVHETPFSRVVQRRDPGPIARATAGARLTFGARSVFRTFVGADAEIGARGSGVGPNGTQRLAAWSIGLALGATVGTP